MAYLTSPIIRFFTINALLHHPLLTAADALHLPFEHKLLGIQAPFVMPTSVTNPPRHDCKKIDITGLDPAFQDISS